MMTIYKYSLKVTDKQVVKLPEHSKILSVQYQQGTGLQLWAVVDPDAPVEDVIIEMFGTGNPIPDIPERRRRLGITNREFISTVQMDSFVWHVFTQV